MRTSQKEARLASQVQNCAMGSKCLDRQGMPCHDSLLFRVGYFLPLANCRAGASDQQTAIPFNLKHSDYQWVLQVGAADTRQHSHFLGSTAKLKTRSPTPAEFIPQFFVQISNRCLAECKASGQSRKPVQRIVSGARQGHKISDGPLPTCAYSHSHRK